MGTIELANPIAGALDAGQFKSGEGAFVGRGTRMASAAYSFAADGGAIGTIGLIGSTAIPSGSIILGGYLDVTVAPTSGGAATIAIQLEAANDIVTAAAISGAPWSTTGRKSVIPAFTGTTSVKTTAARDISAVIGTAALTAGAFTVVLFYITPA